MSKGVVLITGASSGIGLRTAVDLAAAGYSVWAGARRVEPMQPIVEAGGHALALDVTYDASIQAAIHEVVAAEGRIDVLINNAGYGLYGAVEQVPPEMARAQMDVNVFGLARMCQLVLPHMRAQGSGRIVNISSIGGTIHAPLGAWYHGSKFFVEGFTNSLRLEVADKGIDAILIAPGVIRSDFFGTLARQLGAVSGTGPYADTAQALMKADEKTPGSDPAVISKLIRRAIEDRRPRTIYRAGQGAVLLYILRRLLPHRWFDRLVMMSYAS